MSARLLKKVLKEQETAEQENNSSYNSDESVSPKMPGSVKNPFDLLSDHDDNEDDRAVNQDWVQGNDLGTFCQSEAQEHKSKQPSVAEVPVESVIANKKSTEKKKKKKKKKNKLDKVTVTKDETKSCNGMLESLSFAVESLQCHPVEDSCKKSVYGNSKVSNNVLQLGRSSVLQIDPKHLSAENEMRRIFGSKVVSSFERGLTVGTSRQSRGGRRGTHSLKRTILVTTSEHWPRWDGSLSMEHLETTCGIHYFRYVHSLSYSLAQKAFEAAKAVHDLNGIANVLLHQPYHIDSLVTLAEYFQLLGEHQRSADAIRQALYGLECAWHPMFTPLQNNCQLKFDQENNKPFFTALFAHMKNMDKRGCHRSALEICKLLLSLDSDDPMGALFCIDYFALRAEEYSWLEEFSDDYGRDNCLWLFPNFSFSLAVCRFNLEGKEHEKEKDREEGTERRASSAELMNQALMLHPTVLKKLVLKVPLKEQVWTGILEHSRFKSEQTGNPSLDHLTSIYVERSYLIWRLPQLQKFLKDSAQSFILTMKGTGSDANDWDCVRKEAFPHEKNEYRHLLLSDFSDASPSMPPENLQQFMIDPRVREFDNGEQVMMNLPAGVPAPVDLSNRNALAVFLESMLPWTDYSREGDEDYQDDHH